MIRYGFLFSAQFNPTIAHVVDTFTTRVQCIIFCIAQKAVQNKKRLSKKSTFCDDMLFTHRFQGNITS